ncbi:MAG TPA: LysR family transcriptional regulator, partial [Mycobacteriales bacterium]|nr:LysR family transcriptional regulator [Mycobacteriales bacterium]
MSVTIQQLIFYRAVARNRSFSNAAKELYTSQPYVSNQIRKLEDHYGVPLFVRSHPRITLTEAGEILYRRVDSLLDDLDDLEQVIQQFQGLRRGTVQFAAAASVGNHVMPEHIASFHRDHPDIVVQGRIGSTEQVLEWLDLDEIEIGVSPRKPESGNLRAEPFYREPIVVIHPAAMQLPDPLPVDTLATLPKVVREDGSRTLAKMYELLQDHPGGMDYVAQLEGTTAVNEAVAAGLGVSLVPERSAKAWIAAGVVGKCGLADIDLHHDLY